MAVVDFIAWAVDRALQTLTEVVKALLEAGATLASLVAATIAQPGDAFDNLLARPRHDRRTLLSESATPRGASARTRSRQFVLTAKRVGQAVIDILLAALEVAGAAVATAISILLNTLAHLPPAQRSRRWPTPGSVFEDALDYDHIYIATESPLNDDHLRDPGPLHAATRTRGRSSPTR